MGNSKYLSNKNIEWHIVSPFLSIVSRLAHFRCSIGTRLVIFAVEGGGFCRATPLKDQPLHIVISNKQGVIRT